MTSVSCGMPHVVYAPIGVIRSSHVKAEDTPIQPVYARECVGRVEVFAEYADGLKDLEGFSHIILLYHLDRAGTPKLQVKPFMDHAWRGVFSTRHPRRPNPVGISVVALSSVDGTTLHISGVDVLDNTPLLDIKPYIPRFDQIEKPCGGWTESVPESHAIDARGKDCEKDDAQ